MERNEKRRVKRQFIKQFSSWFCVTSGKAFKEMNGFCSISTCKASGRTEKCLAESLAHRRDLSMHTYAHACFHVCTYVPTVHTHICVYLLHSTTVSRKGSSTDEADSTRLRP